MGISMQKMKNKHRQKFHKFHLKIKHLIIFSETFLANARKSKSMMIHAATLSDVIGLVQMAGARIGLEIPEAAIHTNSAGPGAHVNAIEGPDSKVHIEADRSWNDSTELTLQFDGGRGSSFRLKTVFFPEGSRQDQVFDGIPNPIPVPVFGVMKEERPYRAWALYRPGEPDPFFLQLARDSAPIDRVDDRHSTWSHPRVLEATRGEGRSGWTFRWTRPVSSEGSLIPAVEKKTNPDARFLEIGDPDIGDLFQPPLMAQTGHIFFGLAQAISGFSGLVDLLDVALGLQLQIPSASRTLLNFGLVSFANYPSTDRSLVPQYRDMVDWILEACRIQDLPRAREQAKRLLRALDLTKFGKKKGLVGRNMRLLKQILAPMDNEDPEIKISDSELHAKILRLFGDVYQDGPFLRKLAMLPEARQRLGL